MAADAVNRFVSGEMQGELRIGRITDLGPWRVVTRDVDLFDPEGRLVVRADQVVVTPDLEAARQGRLRFSSAALTGGHVWLLPGREEGLPSFLDTFEPTVPSVDDGTPGLHAIVDGISLEDVVIEGELLGLTGIRLEDVRARGRLETLWELEVQLHAVRGRATAPFPFAADLTALVGSIHTDPHRGIRLHARAERDDGQRARANIVYAVPEGRPADSQAELDLLVAADPLQAESIHQIGFDWAELLTGRVEGHLRLRGPEQDLQLSANARTDGGELSLRGRVTEARTEVRGRTESLDLGRVARGFPSIEVAGSARLAVDAPADGQEGEPRVRFDLEPTTFGGYAIPAFTLDGALEEDAIRIDRVDAPYAGGEVHGSGRVAWDGPIDVSVRGDIPQIAADPNIRRLVPGARGGVAFDVDLRTDLAADPNTDVHLSGTVQLRGLRYGSFAARRLRASGSLDGDPSRPRLRVDLSGEGVRAGGVPLGAGELSLRGGPRRYDAALSLADRGRRLRLDGQVAWDGRELRVDSNDVALSVGGTRFTGQIADLRYRPDVLVSAERIRMQSGGQRVEADGVWRFRGPDELHAELKEVHVGRLAELLGYDEVPIEGRLSTEVTLTGDVESPRLTLEGSLRRGQVPGVGAVSGRFDVVYESFEGAIEATADLGGGRLALGGTAVFDPAITEPLEALRYGQYELALEADGVSVAVLRTAGVDLPEMDGTLEGRLTMTGMPEIPTLAGEVRAPALALPGWPALDVVLTIAYGEARTMVARTTVDDPAGRLIEAEGSAVIDLVSLLRNDEQRLEILSVVPWRLSFRQEPRALSELPAPARALVPALLLPLEVSASGTLSGGAFEPRGELYATLRWGGDTSALPCGAGSDPRGFLRAEMRDGVTTAMLRGFVGSQRSIVVEGSAATPLADWLAAGGVDRLPAVQARATVERLATDRLPIVCEYLAGPVSGTVDVAGLLGDDPRLEARLSSSGMSVRRIEPRRRRGPSSELPTETMDVTLEAHYASGRFTIDGVDADLATGGRVGLTGEIPVRWGGDQLVPTLSDEGDVSVAVDLEQAPLALLLVAAPGIGDVEGSVFGRVEVEGLLGSPRFAGHLWIQDGRLSIQPVGQHLHDLEGDLRLEGRRVELVGLYASDGDGKAGITGDIDFDGWLPSAADLRVQTEDFPVRQEGALLATVSGIARVRAEIGADDARATMTVQTLRVDLPERFARTLQDLAPHPDVRPVGVARTDPEQAEGATASYPVRVRVIANDPFWVRRNDFGAQVRANLDVTYRDPDLLIGGWADLRRGTFDVFGKTFDVQEGSMAFDGGAEINPEVTLTASHQVSGTDARVIVSVTGRLAEPEIVFTSERSSCESRGEIIALLVSGRCNVAEALATGTERQASEQAADFLAGVLAGVLTLSVQEEFGSRLPRISIESGDQAFRSARVRAGYNFDELIPDSLRRWVRGIYVEGSFTTPTPEDDSGGSTTSGQADVGFLLRLQFPHNIVGEVAGSPTSDSWSVDVAWEP